MTATDSGGDAAASTPVQTTGTGAVGRAAPTPVQVRLGYGAVMAGMLMFSLGPVLAAEAELQGLAVAFWRAWIACAFFGLVAATKGALGWQAMRLSAFPGICFGLSIGLFFEAAQRTSVANTALIAVLIPVPMLIAARFVFSEPVGLPDAGWLAIALGGAAFMILVADNGGTSDPFGDFLAVLSTFAGAAYFVLGRRARQKVDTVPFMVGMMFWGGVVLTPLTFAAGQDLITTDGTEWLRMIAIGLIPGMGHLFINYSHASVPLVIMGLAQLLIPVGATFMAWLFLDQDITVAQLVGICIVLAALAVHTVYRSRLPTPAPG
ncbi:MAG: DMT family transporter [Acidimicrobiales bacterium]